MRTVECQEGCVRMGSKSTGGIVRLGFSRDFPNFSQKRRLPAHAELKARAGVPFLANWTGGLARWTRERTGLLPIYVAAEGYWGARAAGGS